MMDYYAIKADQCAYFIQLYDELEISRRVSLLPNFAYSYALAKFYNGDEKEADDAVSSFQYFDSLLFVKFVYILVCFIITTRSAFTCSKLTIETLGQGVKYVQS